MFSASRVVVSANGQSFTSTIKAIVIPKRFSSSRRDGYLHAVSVGDFERFFCGAQLAQFGVCDHGSLPYKTLPSRPLSVNECSASEIHKFTVTATVENFGFGCILLGASGRVSS